MFLPLAINPLFRQNNKERRMMEFMKQRFIAQWRVKV